MLLDQYNPIFVEDFQGLYARGSINNTPPDHFFIFRNVETKGQRRSLSIREGTGQSINTNGIPVRRMFQSNISSVGFGPASILFTDGSGHIYQGNPTGAPTILFTLPGMIDFAAINIFNRVYILPIGARDVMQVWDGFTIRPALGFAPSGSLIVTVNGANTGHITAGLHCFAVAFVTSSGFITTPGPLIAGGFNPTCNTFFGNESATISDIPIGPPGTTQRVILATKANLPNGPWFFVPGNGTINDNTTTSVTVDFLDTDLVVDATYLFNLRQEIISASNSPFGGASLILYKGRLVILDGTTTNQVNISASGLVENFDSVTGVITLDTQQDTFSSGFDYYGTLYVFGEIGLHATTDNGGEPSSWTVSLVDMSKRLAAYSLTSVQSSKYPGPLGSIILGVNRQGLYAFNGNVIRPSLSTKIQNIFDTFTHGAETTPMLCVDATRDILYMLLPLNGQTLPGTLVVGDFSNGLTAEAIRWSTFDFGWGLPQSIAMCNIVDTGGFVRDYWLRIGRLGSIDRLSPDFTNDSGQAIIAQVQSALFQYTNGFLEQFRFLKMEAIGTGGVLIQLQNEYGTNIATVLSWNLAATPGSRDFQRHINYLEDRMSVTLTMPTFDASFTMNRLEVWGKSRYQMYPG